MEYCKDVSKASVKMTVALGWDEHMTVAHADGTYKDKSVRES
jgi:hypothetical protein